MRRRAFHVVVLLAAIWTVAEHDVRADETEISVIGNAATDFGAIDQGQLEAIFSTTKRFNSDGSPLQPCNLPARNPVRVAFDLAVLRMDPDEVARFWIDRKIRGGAPPPRQIPEEELVVRFVAKMPGGIGYVTSAILPPEVRVVAVIRGGRVVPK